MVIIVEAVYQNGVLRPERPLPLQEDEKVRVTVESAQSWADRTYGLMRWTGDPEILRHIAEDPEFGIREAP